MTGRLGQPVGVPTGFSILHLQPFQLLESLLAPTSLNPVSFSHGTVHCAARRERRAYFSASFLRSHAERLPSGAAFPTDHQPNPRSWLYPVGCHNCNTEPGASFFVALKCSARFPPAWNQQVSAAPFAPCFGGRSYGLALFFPHTGSVTRDMLHARIRMVKSVRQVDCSCWFGLPAFWLPDDARHDTEHRVEQRQMNSLALPCKGPLRNLAPDACSLLPMHRFGGLLVPGFCTVFSVQWADVSTTKRSCTSQAHRCG
jgi:hypothetical protein